MRVSKQTDYALRALFTLVEHHGGVPIPIRRPGGESGGVKRLDSGEIFTVQLSKELFRDLQPTPGEPVFVELKNVHFLPTIFRFEHCLNSGAHLLIVPSMADKHYRSLIKAVSWRTTGTIDTMIVSYLVTGQFKLALTISAVELFTKIFLYYVHERVWEKLSFGRVKEAKKENSNFEI